MKVQFFCNSGANIHSCNDSDIFDTVEDLGYEDGEWEKLSDDDKYEAAAEYWNGMGFPEVYYEEIKQVISERIRKAKALNPGPSRRERRQKADRKKEHKQRIAELFAEAARKHAGRAPEPKPEAPKKPPKPIKAPPAWMVKQETARLSWAWKPTTEQQQ